MTDIEIAENTDLMNKTEIAKQIDVPEDEIEVYGKYKAKISDKLYEKLKDKENGKLILVTAMSPTPLGEGKTTKSIAKADGLRKIRKKSIFLGILSIAYPILIVVLIAMYVGLL